MRLTKKKGFASQGGSGERRRSDGQSGVDGRGKGERGVDDDPFARRNESDRFRRSFGREGIEPDAADNAIVGVSRSFQSVAAFDMQSRIVAARTHRARSRVVVQSLQAERRQGLSDQQPKRQASRTTQHDGFNQISIDILGANGPRGLIRLIIRNRSKTSRSSRRKIFQNHRKNSRNSHRRSGLNKRDRTISTVPPVRRRAKSNDSPKGGR